jgi:hypothetical protein
MRQRSFTRVVQWRAERPVRLRRCEDASRDTLVLSQQSEFLIKRYVGGEDRSQSTFFPERLDDYIAEDNPMRVIDAFVEALNLVC